MLSSVCVVLIEEYHLLCSSSRNDGLLATVEAGTVLGTALGTMRTRHVLE